MQQEEPKFKKIADAADGLSLGISMVVAILIGVGLGLWMKSFFGVSWLLWIGVALGVAAAVLNVFKAYLRQKAILEDGANDPRYNYTPYKKDDDDDDEKY